MKPIIDKTKFGSITIQGIQFEYDVIIRLDGSVEKRNKALSKEVFGTSHTISGKEAQFVYETGARQVIIGAGQHGQVKVSSEAEEYFREKNCPIEILRTPKAIEAWNTAEGAVIGLFHLTC